RNGVQHELRDTVAVRRQRLPGGQPNQADVRLVALERPPSATANTPAPPSAPPTPEFVTIELRAPRRPHRSFIERYQQHLWISAISGLVIAVALSPFALGYLGRQPSNSRPAASQVGPAPTSNLSTSVAITASEFKFGPTSVQV